jgi:hypothetical protein
MAKPRTRLIDGRAYVEVQDVQGKYREHLPHHELHDGRRWMLIEDVQRLQADSTGNRNIA